MAVNIAKRTDHLGNVYKSERAMIEHYNLSRTTYYTRLKYGLSLKDALTMSAKDFNDFLKANSKNIDARTDFLGNLYDNVEAMCNHYGIVLSTYQYRLSLGWSKEKALTAYSSKSSICRKLEGKIMDHKGNNFQTVKDMCEYYNIDPFTFYKRIENNWSVEKALTTSSIKSSSPEENRTDPFGKVYDTVVDMCKAYNINYKVYINTISRGSSKEEALRLIPKINKTMRLDTKIFEDLIVNSFAYEAYENIYFKCTYNRKTVIMSKEEILEEFRKQLERKKQV